MDRRTFVTGVAAGCTAFTPAWLPRAGCRPADPERFVERWSWAMGQVVRLRLFAHDEGFGYEAAQAALAELRRVEAVLSRFDSASELAALHATAGRGSHRASADLLAALTAAASARTASGAAFDIAVEPLMRVWGFREPRLAPPGAVELAEARAALAAAEVRITGARVTLPAAHTRLDLGGLGVGYGIDRAMEVLRSRGIRHALLEVSGDIRAMGAPPGEAGWLVDIAAPGVPAAMASAPPPVATVRLVDEALATSGQDAAAIFLGCLRVGHVMDPRVGRPATGHRQVTVTAPTALLADLASTALLAGGHTTPGVRQRWVS